MLILTLSGHVLELQGSQSKAVRVGAAPGAKAKYVAMAGLGKKEKAKETAEWGLSTWQVRPLCCH